MADIASLKCAVFAGKEAFAANAEAAPANLSGFQNQFGKEIFYKVTGELPTAGTSGIWGSDVYTLDSKVSVAAVHAGVVRPGETTVVKVVIMASPPQYVSTERNGVTSTHYGNYPNGAYMFAPEK